MPTRYGVLWCPDKKCILYLKGTGHELGVSICDGKLPIVQRLKIWFNKKGWYKI